MPVLKQRFTTTTLVEDGVKAKNADDFMKGIQDSVDAHFKTTMKKFAEGTTDTTIGLFRSYKAALHDYSVYLKKELTAHLDDYRDWKAKGKNPIVVIPRFYSTKYDPTDEEKREFLDLASEGKPLYDWLKSRGWVLSTAYYQMEGCSIFMLTAVVVDVRGMKKPSPAPSQTA